MLSVVAFFALVAATVVAYIADIVVTGYPGNGVSIVIAAATAVAFRIALRTFWWPVVARGPFLLIPIYSTNRETKRTFLLIGLCCLAAGAIGAGIERSLSGRLSN